MLPLEAIMDGLDEYAKGYGTEGIERTGAVSRLGVVGVRGRSSLGMGTPVVAIAVSHCDRVVLGVS